MNTRVITTYLEIKDAAGFLPVAGFRERMEVRDVENDAYLSLVLFAGVGLPWRWYSRLKWTIPEWEEYFSGSRVKTFLGFHKSAIAGYYELEYDDSGSAEIKFFGLFPRFIGSGIGGILLSHAVHSAYSSGAGRVWLHTCSNDSGSALGNYLARGFRIFREEEGFEDVPGRDELAVMVSDFFRQYMDHFS